jgi:ferredoxin
MQRKVISIDESKCNGCGLCLPGCPEGAIQLIDNKARLVSDLMCDGLGACLGHCPQGAITIEEREAEPYDESKVMANIVKQGVNTLKAHLAHLREHQQHEYYQEAIKYLAEHHIPVPTDQAAEEHAKPCGCPGSHAMSFAREEHGGDEATGSRPSQLTHWPLQMHLISPRAPHYQGADLLLAADCVAYSLGDFHKDYLKGKALAIACPKLDDGQEIYVEKIKEFIDVAKINTLTVMIMQVPCCHGLLNVAQEAASQAKRRVPIKCIVVSLQGEILEEEWVN